MIKINEDEILGLIKKILSDGYRGYYQDLIAEAVDPNISFTREKDAVAALQNFGIERAYSLVPSFKIIKKGNVYVANMNSKTLAKKVYLNYTQLVLDRILGSELKGLASAERNKHLICLIEKEVKK
jgi:hypothetical protein